MSGYKHFAVIGAGNVGAFFVEELLKIKAAGNIDSVLVVTRSVRCDMLSNPLHI